MKSTQSEVRKRVEEILSIRLSGAEFADVREYAREKGWNRSDGQLWRYIQHADKLLALTLEKDRQKLLNRHHAQRRAIFARAMSVSDYSTALRAADSEAKLLGLFPEPSKPGPATTVNVAVNILTDEQLTRIAMSQAALPEPVEPTHEHDPVAG